MQEVIEKAYQIFKHYKLKEELDVCTHCCVTITELNQLTNTPLKELSFNLIDTHNSAATSSKPPVEEFKYFLPRYLELIANYKFPSHSTELSLKRFESYEKEEFNSQEWQIIEEFCIKFFKQILSNYPIPENDYIDSILIMIFTAKIDITKVLKIWEIDESENGNKHFTDFVNYGLSKRKNKLNNVFSSKKLDLIIEEWLSNNELFKNKYNQVKYES